MNSLAAIATLHGAIAAVFTVVAGVAVLRLARTHAPGARPRVVLLRAAEKVDAALAARLEEDRRAYAGEVVRIVCVPSASGIALDPAIAIAASGAADEEACNRKARHLAAGLALAAARGWLEEDPVVVHADADVALAPADLDALVDALERDAPGGAAFAAPVPIGGDRTAEAIAQAILTSSAQAFAVVWALARLTGSAPALAGKLVAMRARTLDAIGGYARLAPWIGDDVALIDALHALRAPVALASRPARAVDPERTVGRLFAQMVRWMRVAGAHRPALRAVYPLLVAPLVPSVALVIASGAALGPSIALGALIAARVALAAVLARGPYRGYARSIAAVPLLALAGDALLLAAAAASLIPAPIAWAGRRYHVARGGRIERVTRSRHPRDERPARAASHR